VGFNDTCWVDGLGSIVNLCDQDGELFGEYAYDSYGNVFWGLMG
jgi:hypothetical protein